MAVIKLFIYPIVVYLSDFLFRQVDYAAIYQPILIGLLLAVIAHRNEVFFLKSQTIWTITAIDFLAATAILYLISFVLPGTFVTFVGALLTAVLLTLIEIPQHFWLLKTPNQ